jgi:uncharacterized membrane protein
MKPIYFFFVNNGNQPLLEGNQVAKPKLSINTSKSGKIFNFIGLLLFFISIFYLISRWNVLPEQVPIHYNASGAADDWGAKGFIFLPLGIGITLWIGIYILEKYPHLHNNSFITAENVERQYRNSSLMLNFLKNELLLLFSFNSFNDVHVAVGNESLLGVWELPIVFILIFGTLAFFIIRSIRIR